MSTHQLAVPRDIRLVTIGIALVTSAAGLAHGPDAGRLLRERDYRFSTIAALVLTIILVGFVLGTHVRLPLRDSL